MLYLSRECDPDINPHHRTGSVLCRVSLNPRHLLTRSSSTARAVSFNWPDSETSEPINDFRLLRHSCRDFLAARSSLPNPKRSCCCVWRLTIVNSQRGGGSKPCDLNNSIAAGDV